MRVGARSLVAAGAVTLALGNLGRIPGGVLGGRSAPVVLNDILLLPVWITLLVVIVRRLRPWPVAGVTVWILAFSSVAALSLAQATTLWNLGAGGALGPAAFLVRWVLYAGWFWLVTVCLTHDEARAGVRHIERGIYAIAVFGIVQSAMLPGFAQMVGAGGAEKVWDEQGRRLVSTMLDPNYAGILIVIALLLRLAREREGRGGHRTVIPFLGVALLLTLSRSALLALAGGVAVLWWTRGINRRLAGIFLGGSVLLLPFITLLLRFAEGFNKLGVDASAAQRLVPWSRALIMLRDHPWLGVGFNAVQQAQRAYGWQLIGGADASLDGGLLFVAAMTGVVGLMVYLGLLAAVLHACRIVYREGRDGDVRALAAGTASATVAVVVHSFFANSLLLPFVMQVLWVLWGCVVVIGRPFRLPTVAVVVPMALLTLTACDPCSGVAACRTEPTLALSGQIVDGSTGKPVRGTGITTGALRAISDDEGLWELSGTLDTTVSAVDVTVQAPGQGPYAIHGLPVKVLRMRGDVQHVGRWTSVPYARFEATLVRRGAPVVGASVSFSPTGGAPVRSAQAGGVSNGAGIFGLELAGTGALGEVVGTLTVTHHSFARPSRLTGFSVPLDYRYGIPKSIATLAVGGQRTYGGEVIFRGTGEKAPGATVGFSRTGGVAMTPTSVQVLADERAFFVLPLDATVDGTVIGDLSVRSADGTKRSTYHGVRFDTYDSTSFRNSGLWAYGERWAWAVEVWTHDRLAPAPNLNVEFRRTGGLVITPDRFIGRTGSDGRFELRATVTDTGTVIGDLTVFAVAGATRVIPNVRLRTFEADDLRFGGVFGVGPALRYVGEVLRQDGTPVQGAQVTWTQVSGVPASPTVLTTTTDANGRFPLTLIPSLDGEVVGTVRVAPLAPWAAGTAFTFTDLRLNSFESGDLRLAVTYRIPAP